MHEAFNNVLVTGFFTCALCGGLAFVHGMVQRIALWLNVSPENSNSNSNDLC